MDREKRIVFDSMLLGNYNDANFENCFKMSAIHVMFIRCNFISISLAVL